MTQRITLNRSRPTVELVSKRQLADMLSVDPTTIDRWRRDGRFPPGIVMTDQCVRWRLSDVEKWLKELDQ